MDRRTAHGAAHSAEVTPATKTGRDTEKKPHRTKRGKLEITFHHSSVPLFRRLACILLFFLNL